MPGNTAALEAGFEYQELYGWYRVLDLKSPSGKVRSVSIEDPTAGHFDDVVVRPSPSTEHVSEYLQVKFHVDVSDMYSSDSLMTETHGLLLRKAWKTWAKLRDEARGLELHLISTWAWDPSDPIAVHIRDARLTRAFVEGSAVGKAAEVRVRWHAYLEPPTEEEFQQFLGSLRLRTGYPARSELLGLVKERMEVRGLKHDDDAAWRGARAVREWMIAGRKEITEALLEDAIERLNLRDVTVDPSVTLWVHTVVKPAETGADYELDWRDLFEGPEDERGHRLRDPDDWNGRLLPELRSMAARINRETEARLLRVRGKSRLSPWFAVGFAFRETTGWVLETEQYGSLWRTDAPRSEIRLLTTEQQLSGPRTAAAIVVSITGDATAAVTRHLTSTGDPVARLIHVSVERPGRNAIGSAGDLSAVADVVRNAVLALDDRPEDVLLFYWGPATGAVFIGHALNGVARRIRLFEEEFGTYLPSITLA
jgi:SMODS-associated and fused to various effectors sensor domain